MAAATAIAGSPVLMVYSDPTFKESPTALIDTVTGSWEGVIKCTELADLARLIRIAIPHIEAGHVDIAYLCSNQDATKEDVIEDIQFRQYSIGIWHVLGLCWQIP